MKTLLPLLFLLVLLASGCTAPDDQRLPDLPKNRSVLEMNTLGPGLHCGSFKIDGSVVVNKGASVIEAAKQAGFSFIGMLIDPYDIRQLGTCERLTYSGLLCIPCQRVGNDEGSFIAIGVRDEISRNQSLDEMVEEALDLGGVVYATQPMNRINKTPWKRWDITNLDGLAVVSPMKQSRQDDENAVARWHTLLNNGQMMHAFGETDIKTFKTPYILRNMLDSSYNCLRVHENLTEQAVKSALKKGSFYVTNGPLINLTVNGRGPGEDFNVSYGEEVVISLEVESDSVFNRVRLIRNGEVIQEIGKPFLRYNTTLNSTILRRTWFSAEVWGPDYTPEYHDPVHAISNPVWVSAVS